VKSEHFKMGATHGKSSPKEEQLDGQSIPEDAFFMVAIGTSEMDN